MQRHHFEIDHGLLIVNDLHTKGSLRIKFKPLSTQVISPAYEALNDLEYAINNGTLDLELHGVSTLLEHRGFELKGKVILRSSHMYDPKINNGSLSFACLKPRSTIIDSCIEHVGFSHFGELVFNQCNFKSNPKELPRGYRAVYFNNLLM